MSADPRLRKAAGADWAFISDASALAIVHELEPAGAHPLPLLRCTELIEIRNNEGPRDPVDVAARFVAVLKAEQIDTLASDSHYRASWEPVLGDADIQWRPAPVKAEDIAQSFLFLRVLIHQRRIILPKSARLKKQLGDVTGTPTGSGLSIKTRRRKDGDGGTSHGDLVSALVLAVWQLMGAADTGRVMGVPARNAGADPRYASTKTAEAFGGIPTGEYREYAADD